MSIFVTRAFAGVLLVLCPLAIVSRGEESWSQWRGPNRDSVLSEVEFPQQLNGKLDLVWEQAHSPSYSGPIVSGDLVFTTETINKESERVTAHKLDTGEVAWTAEWPGAMAVPFFAASNGDWIRSTPACDGSNLVVLGMVDVMVCLDPKTGSEKWRVDFPKDMKSPIPSFGAVCSPLIDKDAVYVQSGGALVKLDLATGKPVWSSLKNAAGMMSSGAFSSPIIGTIRGVRQLLVATRTELCGVDLEDGGVLWRQPIESFRGMNILTPTILGDRVFSAAHSGTSQMFDIKKDGGKWTVERLWSQKSQGYMSSPVVVDNTIYLHMKNQRVVGLSTEDGSIRWTSSPYGKYWSMVSNGEQILALDNRGDLLLINPNEAELEIVDTMKVANDSWAHLAVEGKNVIVRDLKSIKVYRW